MAPGPLIGALFIAIAAIFFVAALRDSRRRAGGSRPARRVWLQIAFIFALVGVGLQLVHLLWVSPR